jgi:group I intron endonuclease
MTGIYRIYNKITGFTYIGQAVDLNRRLCGHRSSLRRGDHHNSHIQNSWKKHGENSFVFEVILQCDASCLDDEEQKQLDLVHISKRYNLSGDCSSPNRGRKHSDKTKSIWSKRRSEYFKNKHNVESMRKKMKIRFMNQKERDNISVKLKKYFSLEESRIKNSRSRGGSIIVGESIDGDVEVVFMSLSDARRAGFNAANIASVIKGSRSQHHGMKWRKL